MKSRNGRIKGKNWNKNKMTQRFSMMRFIAHLKTTFVKSPDRPTEAMIYCKLQGKVALKATTWSWLMLRCKWHENALPFILRPLLRPTTPSYSCPSYRNRSRASFFKLLHVFSSSKAPANTIRKIEIWTKKSYVSRTTGSPYQIEEWHQDFQLM